MAKMQGMTQAGCFRIGSLVVSKGAKKPAPIIKIYNDKDGLTWAQIKGRCVRLVSELFLAEP